MNIKTLFFSIICLFAGYTGFGQINVNDLDLKRIESDGTVIWEQVSCGNGGMSNTIRYHPTIPGHVTMLGDMWCAYRSTNNGKRWHGITDFDGNGSFERQRDLVYSTSNPEFGISICSSLMWSTQDTGRTWQPVKNCPWYELGSDGLDRSSWLSKVAGLGIDPTNKDIWFVGGGKFVRGDVTFSCYKNPTQAHPFITDVANEGKLWRTKDGGESWTDVGGDLDPKAQVGPVKFYPKNPQLVFAATTHGVYRSENGGDNWTNISAGKLDNNIIMDLDYYYDAETDTFILYVIDQVQYHPNGTTTRCSGGIFQSKDFGETWENINGDLYLDFNQLNGGVPYYYYRYIAKWFGISLDEAMSKYPELPTRALQPMDQLTTDPTRMGALYVGLPSTHTNNSIIPGRLWTTDNNGKNWINTARLYTHVWENDKSYWEQRGNPWHQNLEIGHESKHVQWDDIYALRGTRGLDVGVDGSVMMLSEHTTSQSFDHGKTWHQVDEDFTPSGALVGRGNSDLPAHSIAQDKRQQQTYLGSGEHRLWITTNDSPDERQAILNIMSAPETVSSIAFDPLDGNTLYCTSSRQAFKQNIFKSTDGGYTWSIHGVATPATDKWGDDFYTNALIIDPINTQNMYLGITEIADRNKSKEGGFFRSLDGGKTFQQSNNGLPSPVRINDIQFDPRDNTRSSLFIAAQRNDFTYHSPISEGGLFYSSDRGSTWTKVNTPLAVRSVQFIRFDHTNRMYITTGYRGNGAGVWYSDDFGKNWTQIFSHPKVECIDISPFDHNLIAITTRFLSKNPGVYISLDRGLTWSKSNTNIVVPQQIEFLHFDIHDASTIWIGTLGSGFYKGKIHNGEKVQVVKVSPQFLEYRNGTNQQLSAQIVNPNYSNETINWKSENPAVATVDENGRITPVGKGQTKIWATAVNGRFSDYSLVIIHDTETGGIKQNFNKKDIKIVPSPIKNSFSIQGINTRCSVNIYGLNGNLMLHSKTIKNINTSKLARGTYIIEILSNEETIVKKVAKL